MNNISFKINTLCAVMALFAAQNAFAAANFTIEPLGTLPTIVTTGQSVSANYIVTNMSNTTRNGYVLQGLPTTVTQNTTSPNCTNPINLGPKASCQLQLDITGAISSNFAICKGSSCTTSTTPLNVTTAPAQIMPNFLYVANYNGTTGSPATICSLSQITGEILSCNSSGGGVISTGPQGLIINLSGTMAYLTGEVASTPGPVYQCSINTDGTFNTCTSITINSPSYFYTYYGTVALSPTYSLAYFSGYNTNTNMGMVVACPIIGELISQNCSDTGATLNNYQTGITINSTGTTAYMTNAYGTGVVTVCDISNNGTSFTNCVNKTGGSNFTFSSSLGSSALNSNGSILYVADNSNSVVYGCSTLPNNTSTFDSCFLAGTVNAAWGIVVNVTGTVAYVTESYADTTYTCLILPNGTFSTCSPTSGFVSAYSAALKY